MVRANAITREASTKEIRTGMAQSTKTETKTQHPPEKTASFSHAQKRKAHVTEGITSVLSGLRQHTDNYANN